VITTLVILRPAIDSRENADRNARRLVLVAAIAFLSAAAVLGNTPPHTPVLIEPSESRAIDPGDVHMATAPFLDDDIDDHLSCSDWEIRSADGQNIVWHSDCAAGVLAVHIHLGDGTFVNAGGRLLGTTRYEVRVRFRDSSNDPSTEWSDWATRAFITSPPSAILPLEIADVLSLPPPRLYDSTGADLSLPAGASIAAGSEHGDLLVSFTGTGSGTTITNPPALANHAFVKVIVSSGAAALSLTETTIEITDAAASGHTICLPALSLPPSSSAAFWIAADGSSFEATADGQVPDFSRIARSGLMPWSVQEPGYRIERVAGGLQLPVNIAFVPNPLPDSNAPLFYITELYGTIRAYLRDGTLRDYATGLLNFNPTGPFPGSGEQGIVGTVVDPETGDLFVAVVYEASPGGSHYPRVIRIHSIDGGRTAVTISTVLDMAGEDVGPSHQISNVSIGPDGKLYVHVGDGFRTELARSLDSVRGKILRLNQDGSPPADNPFYDGSDGITARDYIFASGFRNPFGGAWRAADASLYEVENGPDVDRLAKVSAGIDYQWSGSDDDMLAHALYNWTTSVAPVNLTFVQSETFLGSGFPEAKFDHAFVSESGPTWASGTTPLGKRIREFAFDGNGQILWTKSFLEYTGTGHATVAALAAGPDGLYFSDLYPDLTEPTDHAANIYRIRFAGLVTIGADIIDEEKKTIRFSSTITVPSYTSLQWDFGDGSISTQGSPNHTFPGNGPYDVTLRVIAADSVTIEDFTRVQFPNIPGAGLTAIYTAANGTTIARVDPNIDFDWQTDAPAPAGTFLSVIWTGEITPPVSALYTFDLRTEGEAVLRIDGHDVINTRNSDLSAMTNPITLEAGQRYTFTLESDSNPLDGVTQLSWSAAGMPPRIVPSSVFYPATERRRSVSH
jgi:glucose/arabinose dehydrogenase